MLVKSSGNGNTTFSEMFDGLEGHSVLYVLHRCTPLAALAPDDVIELLRKRPLSTPVPSPVLSQASPGSEPSTPVLADDGSQSVAENQSIRQLQRMSSNTATSERERDISLYRGFYAIQCAINAVKSSLQLMGEPERIANPGLLVSQPGVHFYEETVRANLKKAKEMLSQIIPLTYRVELLENIFSLLFLKVSDFHKMNLDDDSDEAVSVKQSAASLSLFELRVSGAVASVSENHPAVDGPSVPTLCSARSAEQFAVGESVAHDLLDMLKGCLIDLQAMKFARQRLAHMQVHHQPYSGLIVDVTETDEASMLDSQTLITSVSVQDFQQRLARLNQLVNEAKWRLQLVCVGSSGIEQSRQSLFCSGARDTDSDISPIVTDDETKFDECHSDGQDDDNNIEVKTKVHVLQLKQTTSEPADEHEEATVVQNTSSMHLSAEDGDQSDSGGEGDTEETEAKKTMMKRKRKSRHSRSPRSERVLSRRIKTKSVISGIVARMLASPDTLLQLCLRNSNYDRSEEVIRMFGLEDTASGHAVVFAEQLEKVSLQLMGSITKSLLPAPLVKTSRLPVVEQSSSLDSKTPVSGHASPVLGFGSLELDALEELLSSSVTPKQFPFISKLSEQTMKLSSSLPSLVLLDLACSSCNGRSLCLDLLTMAIDRAQALESESDVVTATGIAAGPIVFLHSVHGLLEQIESMETCLRLLLNQGTCPLATDLWTASHELTLMRQASQDSVRLEAQAAESVPVTEVERANAGQKSPLREAMETLLKAFTDNSEDCASYLRTLFMHVDNLSSLLISCEEESSEWA